MTMGVRCLPGEMADDWKERVGDMLMMLRSELVRWAAAAGTAAAAGDCRAGRGGRALMGAGWETGEGWGLAKGADDPVASVR